MSTEFRSAVRRSLDDNVITAQERTALAYQAGRAGAGPGEQAFLDNEVRLSETGTATFEPSDISFPSGPAPGAPVTQASQTIERDIERYTPNNPMPADRYNEVRGSLRELYNTEPERAITLGRVLNAKADQAARSYADRVISMHTDIMRDGAVTDDEYNALKTQFENLQGYSEIYNQPNALTPETKETFDRARRLFAAFERDRGQFPTTAPAASPAAADSEAASGNQWSVTADVTYEDRSSTTGTNVQTFSIGAAASVDVGDVRLSGAVDVTRVQVSGQATTELPMVTLPLQSMPTLPSRQARDGTVVSGSVSLSDGNGQRFTASGRSDGYIAGTYERRMRLGGRDTVGAVDISRNFDTGEVQIRGEIRVPLQGPIG